MTPRYRYGRLAPRHDPDRLRMARFVDWSALPDVPAGPFDWARNVKTAWGVLGNDRYGDCTIACILHMFMNWAASSGQPTPPITEQGAVNYYFGLTGGADTGCVVLDVLNAVQQRGLFGVRDIVWAPLNPQDPRQLRAASYLFGGAYLACELPYHCEQDAVWDVPPVEPLAGGHAFNRTGDKDNDHPIVTWGQARAETDRFEQQQVDEAYAIYCPSLWLKGGKSPLGHTDAQLRYWLAALGGPPAPVPPDPTPPTPPDDWPPHYVDIL